jgi:hypothetical protein
VADRWAIGTDEPSIVLPEGCAESGAWRHAREHAAETGTEVRVYRDAGYGWKRYGATHPPMAGYLDVKHYHGCNLARCAHVAAPVVSLAEVLDALQVEAQRLDRSSAPTLTGLTAGLNHARVLLAERFGSGQAPDPDTKETADGS